MRKNSGKWECCRKCCESCWSWIGCVSLLCVLLQRDSIKSKVTRQGELEWIRGWFRDLLTRNFWRGTANWRNVIYEMSSQLDSSLWPQHSDEEQNIFLFWPHTAQRGRTLFWKANRGTYAPLDQTLWNFTQSDMVEKVLLPLHLARPGRLRDGRRTQMVVVRMWNTFFVFSC